MFIEYVSSIVRRQSPSKYSFASRASEGGAYARLKERHQQSQQSKRAAQSLAQSPGSPVLSAFGISSPSDAFSPTAVHSPSSSSSSSSHMTSLLTKDKHDDSMAMEPDMISVAELPRHSDAQQHYDDHDRAAEMSSSGGTANASSSSSSSSASLSQSAALLPSSYDVMLKQISEKIDSAVEVSTTSSC